MKNSIPKTFSRQLLPKTTVTLLAICTLVMWIGLWFLQEQDSLSYQIETVLPKNEHALNNLQFQREIFLQTSDIESLEEGGELNNKHGRLVDIAKQWQADMKVMRPLFDTLNGFDRSVLTRVDHSSQDNEALRQQALTLILSTQTQLLTSLQTSSQTLIEPSHDVLLQYINALLSDIAIGLNELSLQTSDIRFEQLSSDVNHLISAYESLITLEVLSSLSEQVSLLEQVFISQQRLIGKWRGTIRLYRQYDNFITTKVLAVLNRQMALNQQEFQVIQAQSKISQALQVIGLQLTSEQIKWLIASLFIGNLLWVFYLILSFRQKIKQHHILLNDRVDRVIEGQLPEALSHDSAEINQVINKIVKISQPKYSEEAYQSLSISLDRQHKVLAKLGRVLSWSLSPTGWSINEAALIEVTLSPDITEHSFRRVISNAQCKQFIQALRNAKKNNTIEIISLNLLSGITVEAIISYKDKQWLGTLAQQTRVIELEERLTLEKEKYELLAQQLQSKNQNAFEKMAEMLVQAMLQSQNMALISGVSIQASYRPLARMFEWIRQQQILSEISSNRQLRKQQDVLLANELFSAVFNAQTEAKLQHNVLLLKCDENLAKEARLDVRLFGRLINAFCRLALKEQFKSKLNLAVKAIDQNAGQQVIKFTAKVITSKSLSELPDHAKWLLSLNEPSEYFGVETYFYAILRRLHGEHVTAELTECGYTLSFDIPITFSASTQPKSLAAFNKMTHVLVLSSDSETQSIIKQYLSRANCQVEGLAKVALFSEQFDLDSIKRRKLDLVVFAQHHMDELTHVKKHLDSLPDERRPKLVVLQQSNLGDLNKVGLHSLSMNPISKESLLTTCVNILGSQLQSNQLLTADDFIGFHYSASQVELLLAVKHPHEYQALTMLLQWLGFNIKMVCHGKAMQKHWQTGRYLVLINEFKSTPYLELATGKLIARGVFQVGQDTNVDQQEPLKLTQEEQLLSKYWHIGFLPNVEQVKSIVQLLAPWLNVNIEQMRAMKRHQNESKLLTSEAKRQGALFNSTSLDQIPQAFELSTFAKNQGSPELAAYMIDTYIEHIELGIEQIETALFEANYQLLNSLFKQLSLIAKILAADRLMKVVMELTHANQSKKFNKLDLLLKQVKIELDSIKTYARAI